MVFASEAKAIFAGGRIDPAPDAQGLIDTFIRWSPSAPDTVFKGAPPGPARNRGPLRCGPARRPSRATGPLRFPPARDGRLAPERGRGGVARRRRGPADGQPGGRGPAAPARRRAGRGVPEWRPRLVVHRRPAAPGPRGPRSTRSASASTTRCSTRPTRNARMAAVLGTQHHEVMCTAADIQAALPDVVWHAEQPLLRTAPVPMFLLSRPRPRDRLQGRR